MKILLSLSTRSEKRKAEIDRAAHSYKQTKKHVTLAKNRVKAAQKKLETAIKYSKSKNPETAFKYKAKLPELKRAVKTYERRLASTIKQGARLKKKYEKLKG
jgi:DNA repair ATPase RecN